MDPYILEGSLKAISVPDILTFINLVKKTGDLVFRNGPDVVHIFWERGEVAFASSSSPEHSLGSFLVRHGKITAEQSRAGGLLVEPGRRHGKILIQQGLLSPKELWWAVKNQVLEIVYSVFHWKEGRFTFEEGVAADDEKIKLSASTTNIVMEGIRRLDEWPRIRELIPSDELAPVLAPAEIWDHSVTFYEEETHLLNLIDGRRTVRDLIHLSTLNEFETLRVLMSFVLARYVIIPTETAMAQVEETDDLDKLLCLTENYARLIRRIVESLERHLPEEELGTFLAAACSAARNPALEGISLQAGGLRDPKDLIANVADLPPDMRHAALDDALGNLMSYLLFEASKYLDPVEKAGIFKMVEDWSGSRH